MIQKISRINGFLLVIFASIAISLFFYVSLSRINYPFAIEWVESNTYIHVMRVLQGKQIYVPPSYDFISMIYTPVYYYIVALVVLLTNKIMFSMRLVSILSSLVSFLMIYKISRMHGITRTLSFVATGLYAASYGVSGYWFDVGRADSLSLMFLLLCYVSLFAPKTRDSLAGITAGLALFLSVSTKQSSLAAAPFFLIAPLVQKRWKKFLWFSSSFFVFTFLFVYVMNTISDGWFLVYTFEIPSSHPLFWNLAIDSIWKIHIVPAFFWSLIIIIAVFVVLPLSQQRQKYLHDIVSFLTFFFLPISMISVTGMAKQWSYINGLMPITVAISVAGVWAYQTILRFIEANTNKMSVKLLSHVSVSSLLLMQFVHLHYDFSAQIPSKTSLESGYRILSLLQQAPDPVFIPTSSYLLHMVNRPTHFHSSSLGDVELAIRHNPNLKLLMESHTKQIYAYLSSRAINTALLSNTGWLAYPFSSENGYYCEYLLQDYPPYYNRNWNYCVSGKDLLF